MRPALGDRDLVVGFVIILRKEIHSLVDRSRNFVETRRTIARPGVRFGFLDLRMQAEIADVRRSARADVNWCPPLRRLVPIHRWPYPFDASACRTKTWRVPTKLAVHMVI